MSEDLNQRETGQVATFAAATCSVDYSITVRFPLLKTDMLIDAETLRDEFNNSMAQHIRWLLSKEGGDLSLFDLIDDYAEMEIMDVSPNAEVSHGDRERQPDTHSIHEQP